MCWQAPCLGTELLTRSSVRVCCKGAVVLELLGSCVAYLVKRNWSTLDLFFPSGALSWASGGHDGGLVSLASLT